MTQGKYGTNDAVSAVPQLLQVASEPDEQRNLIIEHWLGAPSFPACRSEQTVYLAVRSLCKYFGVSSAGQLTNLQRNDIIGRYLRMFRMQTKGGRQPVWCLQIRAVMLWVVTLDLKEVREDVQQDLLAWSDELMDASMRIFQHKEAAARLDASSTMFLPPVETQARLQALEEEVPQMRRNYDAILRIPGKRMATMENIIIPRNQHYDPDGSN